MKLKDYLKKFNLKPDITQEMKEIDVGTPPINDYYYDTYEGKKFLVLTGSNDYITAEIVIDSEEVNIYGYKKGKTPKKDIPDSQEGFDKKGHQIRM